jgi:hypothetical protein
MVCTQCGAVARDDAFGWRGYRCDDPEYDDVPAMVVYCAFCALEQFGPLPHQMARDRISGD